FFGIPSTPYYFNIFANWGEAITKLVLSGTSSFETDNYSAGNVSVPVPIVGAGLPGIITVLGGAGLRGWWRRRQDGGSRPWSNLLSRFCSCWPRASSSACFASCAAAVFFLLLTDQFSTGRPVNGSIRTTRHKQWPIGSPYVSGRSRHWIKS